MTHYSAFKIFCKSFSKIFRKILQSIVLVSTSLYTILSNQRLLMCISGRARPPNRLRTSRHIRHGGEQFLMILRCHGIL
nr:MAG TPA: hypothetical protein [Caudoviricetes sp.]DAS11436.1 MAG TPA: hypothetical protein [Caudoviricetes sp.]